MAKLAPRQGYLPPTQSFRAGLGLLLPPLNWKRLSQRLSLCSGLDGHGSPAGCETEWVLRPPASLSISAASPTHVSRPLNPAQSLMSAFNC